MAMTFTVMTMPAARSGDSNPENNEGGQKIFHQQVR
jgi:hypothetical protein